MESKLKQLKLPNVTILVKKGQNTWERVDELPTKGRVRIKGEKRQPHTK